MKRMKLGARLILSFGAVSVIVLLLGLVGYYGAARSVESVNEIGAVRLPSVESLMIIEAEAESIRGSIRTLAIPGLSKDVRERQYRNLIKSRERYEKAWKVYEPLPQSPEEALVWKEFVPAWNAWREVNNQAVELSKKMDLLGAEDKEAQAQALAQFQQLLLTKVTDRAHTAMGFLDKLVHINSELGAVEVKKAFDQASFLKTFSFAAMILGVLLALGLGFFISRSLTRIITNIVASLNDGSNQVAAAATEVSSASQSLAQGSSEQAASLEETSASLEEMASMTRTNADNARQADALMGEAARVVDTAHTSMEQLATSMQEVSKASEDTAKIIKTIDEIAFQTNLLALNAAVEAARAGEAGAGFAVVADEVRALAMRAAEAAKNTAVLIEGTVSKVKGGTELMGKTAEVFSQMTGSTAKVKELVAEIAAASGEQAQGVEQINKAVNEMNQVTQQVAANAEESASASEELNAQSEQMKGVVQELVALVGSGANGNGRVHKVASGEGKARRLGALMKQTLTAGGKPAPHKGLTPQQIIPLEDDNFKDF
jgi:methyl-accepting chemotaxis protein